jgi:hypothetical protein
MFSSRTIDSSKNESLLAYGSDRSTAHLRTIAGYEAMNMIRKGQVRWVGKGDVLGQVAFIERRCIRTRL